MQELRQKERKAGCLIVIMISIHAVSEGSMKWVGKGVGSVVICLCTCRSMSMLGRRIGSDMIVVVRSDDWYEIVANRCNSRTSLRPGKQDREGEHVSGGAGSNHHRRVSLEQSVEKRRMKLVDYGSDNNNKLACEQHTLAMAREAYNTSSLVCGICVCCTFGIQLWFNRAIAQYIAQLCPWGASTMSKLLVKKIPAPVDPKHSGSVGW